VDDPDLADLGDLPFVTIDNPDSRDLDQALHIARDRGGGGYLVDYAIADASYYVRPGSALFAEALSRGASYYLPGLTIPMLPRVLCEGLVSLNQGQLRRALVFRIHLDVAGACVGIDIVRARVRSVRKLSYPGVQRYYDDPGGSDFSTHPWRETLDLLREVGQLRIADARRRDVVQYRRRELEVVLDDEETLGFTAMTDDRLEVERYNEQISLLCNVEGARLLLAARGEEQVQALFRVHPAPSAAALDSLAEIVGALVTCLDLDPEVWRWRQGNGRESLADYLDRLPRLGRLGRVRRAVERQARLLNERSTFEEEPAAHHGVGAPVYARFTAPMREIVGVFTHKEASEALSGPQGCPPAEDDLVLRRRVADAGNRAKEIQRRITKEANKLVLDRLLGRELGQASAQRQRRLGTVMGLAPTRVYVQLDEPALDVKVYVQDLEAQMGSRLVLTEPGVQLSDPDGVVVLRLGDPVRVTVAGYDDERERWIFHLETMGPG
jgi:ribonuclease R